MKRIVSVLYFLIINIVIIAQTQYDYYDDDVAHEKPVIDGYTILGFVILGIFWVIFKVIKAEIDKHIDKTPKVKAPTPPKPKSSIEIMKEEIEKARRKRELEWEAMVEAKLRAEAIEILKNEYGEPHIMDNVKYVLKYDTLRENTIDAFVRGYIKGCFNLYSYLSITEIKKRFHPIVVLGYLRGLEEEKKVWEKFGKFPG